MSKLEDEDGTVIYPLEKSARIRENSIEETLNDCWTYDCKDGKETKPVAPSTSKTTFPKATFVDLKSHPLSQI